MKTYMKHLFITFFAILNMNIISSCNKDNSPLPEPDGGNQIQLTIGGNRFTATLYQNETAGAFKKLLPMTINMKELNGNEKYYDLPNNMPTNASNPGRIQNGDLMIYGSRTLVLFYKSFNTSYSYTRLARIDDPSGLQNALGSGNVTVTFELKD